jgi:hypothetical protein
MVQRLGAFDLTCPFASLVLRDSRHEVTRTHLSVADDQQWTLKADVQLFTNQPQLDKGLLVWCGKDDAEILRIAWDRARDVSAARPFRRGRRC